MPQSIYENVHWNAWGIIGTGDTAPQFKGEGVITEVTLPSLSREMDDTVRAGELGVVSRPKKYGDLELSFSCKSIFDDLITCLARATNESMDFTAVACLQDDSGTPVTYKLEAKGFISEMPLGELSEDGIESEYTMMCYYYKQTIGTDVIIYDPRNYILSIGGTNIFTNVKDIIMPPPVV